MIESVHLKLGENGIALDWNLEEEQSLTVYPAKIEAFESALNDFIRMMESFYPSAFQESKLKVGRLWLENDSNI